MEITSRSRFLEKEQELYTSLYVLIEKLVINKSLQRQDDSAVGRVHEFRRDIGLDNIIQLFGQYQLHLHRLVNLVTWI